MAIFQYEKNGKVLFHAYVHVRSTHDRGFRIQKNLYNIENEKLARREEKRLLQIAVKEMARHDGKGLYWEDVVHRWKVEAELGSFGEYGSRTIDDYMSIINAWCAPWMRTSASDLNKSDGRDLIRRMEHDSLSKSYQKKVKNVINRLYEWGIESKLIIGVSEGPMRGLHLDKSPERIPQILSLEEMRKLLYEAKRLGHPWYPVWAVAIMTGMRSGELHALTWEQIDFEKELVFVHKSYCPNTEDVGPTKGRYWRTVPMSRELRSLFLELKEDRLSNQHVLPRFKEWDNGDQAVPLKEFLAQIGVKVVKFHTLRACFATQMLANGVPAPIVMKVGGWKKSDTMDIYLRLAGVDVKGATEGLRVAPDVQVMPANVVGLFS